MPQNRLHVNKLTMAESYDDGQLEIKLFSKRRKKERKFLANKINRCYQHNAHLDDAAADKNGEKISWQKEESSKMHTKLIKESTDEESKKKKRKIKFFTTTKYKLKVM